MTRHMQGLKVNKKITAGHRNEHLTVSTVAEKLQKSRHHYSGADPEICERGSVPPFPSSSLPLPFSFFLSACPLEVGPLKPAIGGLRECCKLPSGAGQSPSRKRIRCTLKLPESHWHMKVRRMPTYKRHLLLIQQINSMHYTNSSASQLISIVLQQQFLQQG